MPKSRRKPESATKPLLPVIHIFCEGEKTEPMYINKYVEKHYFEAKRLKVIDVKRTRKNTPIQLVDEAKKLINTQDLPKHDSVWVVYDRESTIKYSDSLHKKALVKAKANGIEVALSNVCFELWLLLHVSENVRAPFSSCDDILKNSPFKKELKARGVKGYTKADEKVFDAICEDIEEAKKRAEAMNKATLSASQHNEENPHLLNPYTRVGELLEAIDKVAKKSNK